MGSYVLFAAGAAIALAALGWFRNARRRALRHVALERGWSFDAHDAAGISRLPLLVLSASSRRRVENVLQGNLRSRSVTVFDLADPREAAVGKPSRSGARSLSCALLRLPARFPHLVIEPDDWTTVTHAPGLAPTDFESGEFNDAFDVRAATTLDAHTIVDARLMAWLLDRGHDVRFELRGDVVSCATSRLPPGRVPELAETVVGFVERLPSVALERYGSA